MDVSGGEPHAPAEYLRRPLSARLVGLVGISLFCEIAYALVTTFTLPLYLKNTLSWAEKDIGPVLSAFLLAETLAKPAWAGLSDKIGRKPLILIGISISAVAVLLMTGVESHAAFLGLSALNGIGGAALWPNVFASVADVTTEEERVGAMSVFNMMYMIGIGGSAPLGSLIYRLSHDHPQYIFPATAILFALGFLFSAVLTPWLRPTGRHEESGLPDQKHRLVWSVLAFFMAMSFFQTLGLQLMNGPLVLYVNQDLGLKEGAIGLPFLALAAVVAAVAIPIGAWGGRWGRVKSVKLGLVLAAGGMFLLPLHATLTWWLAVAIPMIIGFLLSIPAWLAILTELAPTAWRGRIYGYVATAQGFGAILGPTIGLWLFGERSHAAPFLVSGAILALTLIAAFIGLHENMRAVVDKPAA